MLTFATKSTLGIKITVRDHQKEGNIFVSTCLFGTGLCKMCFIIEKYGEGKTAMTREQRVWTYKFLEVVVLSSTKPPLADP